MLVIFIQSCKKELPLIPEKKSDLVAIKRLIALGDNYFKNGQYDSSYYYFDKAKLACNPQKDPLQFIYSISNLATIQQNQGDFSGSETTAMEAMPVLETTTNQNSKWNIYTILGNNYLNTFDYENAHYYYNKALNLKTDQPRINAAKNNMAVYYMEKNEYQKAINILLPLTLKKEVLKDPETFSRIIDNLGYCYFKTANPKAIKHLSQSLKIREKNKDDWGLTASYFHHYFFYAKSNPILATYFAKQAYKKSTLINSVDDRLHSLEILIKNSTANQIKKYAIKYVTINDSIAKVRQKSKNQFAKMKYDSKKTSNEILLLKAQKAKNALELQLQKNTTLNLYFLIGVLLTITGFIYYYLVEKSKQGKIKTSYDTEVRIAKKLHDELANDVYHTIAFVETKDLSSSHNKETLLDNLDTIYSRTRNISKENSTIAMGPDFIPNLKEMISGFNTDTVNILIYEVDTVNWLAMADIKKITVYRILQELLINMKKHSKSSLVVMSFKIYENNLHIEYTDNGIGAAIEKLNSKNGLQNVENRILAIKGTITFNTKSGKGFKSSIIFPI
ncbi:ATP-binding protein [Flavobacterium sp. ALD4]|uniref:tetratricopeptide repeat-containing sensor histidine kinase n=1 Tax=Flavobacterium sp. ALD4 TaxID=2058314 RepID=UPI000C32D191|nr:ATP-binding protein [Flavobacterium sp. ALD4]PKH68196.1 ATP-binding protein [Flavobacterium sp. ALD4]